MDNLRFRGRDYYYMSLTIIYLTFAYFRPERAYSLYGILHLLWLFSLPLAYEIFKFCESEYDEDD